MLTSMRFLRTASQWCVLETLPTMQFIALNTYIAIDTFYFVACTQILEVRFEYYVTLNMLCCAETHDDTRYSNKAIITKYFVDNSLFFYYFLVPYP